MRTLFGVVREELPNPKFCSANVAFDKFRRSILFLEVLPFPA